ncbi:helix-turn-helix domain-containing GNAT family N-acetyltransferase [Terrarubrum flagellatum]|uniref:bifunctional helix-turn-helix transcriptional regulator/GNAT family N-acetyltransferase n=1 Tax=Terrirubrum flagellatum TaxID=2895980 RepID=UPI0031452003
MSQAPAANGTDDAVAAVRRFSRFYTRTLGVLGGDLYDSDLSLTEARVLYELAMAQTPRTAIEVGRDLGVDAGYMSRILRGFAARGLIARKPSTTDGRARILTLTKKGRAAFARVDRISAEEVGHVLAPLTSGERRQVITAMSAIERALGGDSVSPITLRAHRPGDMGWVVAKHGELYAREYGWDLSFEALVAEIAAGFIRNFDPDFERCWIAEMDGEPVGSVFIVKASDEVAKLRLLIIDPRARGRGLGKKLVDECIRFSRERGYRKIMLWTNDVLTAARAIYVKAGFTLTESEKHHSFGKELVGETWELEF